jgi:hypothetical protein
MWTWCRTVHVVLQPWWNIYFYSLKARYSLNSVVFTQEYLQLTLLPVHFKLQFFSVLEIKNQIKIILRWNISSLQLFQIFEKKGVMTSHSYEWPLMDTWYRFPQMHYCLSHGKITICHVTFDVNSLGEIFTSTVWKHGTAWTVWCSHRNIYSWLCYQFILSEVLKYFCGFG